MILKRTSLKVDNWRNNKCENNSKAELSVLPSVKRFTCLNAEFRDYNNNSVSVIQFCFVVCAALLRTTEKTEWQREKRNKSFSLHRIHYRNHNSNSCTNSGGNSSTLSQSFFFVFPRKLSVNVKSSQKRKNGNNDESGVFLFCSCVSPCIKYGCDFSLALFFSYRHFNYS